MSWWGGGDISGTPGLEFLNLAMYALTFFPGNWPPSPGFAPCAILISNWSALAKNVGVTPKRPEATWRNSDAWEQKEQSAWPAWYVQNHKLLLADQKHQVYLCASHLIKKVKVHYALSYVFIPVLTLAPRAIVTDCLILYSVIFLSFFFSLRKYKCTKKCGQK